MSLIGNDVALQYGERRELRSGLKFVSSLHNLHETTSPDHMEWPSGQLQGVQLHPKRVGFVNIFDLSSHE